MEGGGGSFSKYEDHRLRAIEIHDLSKLFAPRRVHKKILPNEEVHKFLFSPNFVMIYILVFWFVTPLGAPNLEYCNMNWPPLPQ